MSCFCFDCLFDFLAHCAVAGCDLGVQYHLVLAIQQYGMSFLCFAVLCWSVVVSDALWLVLGMDSGDSGSRRHTWAADAVHWSSQRACLCASERARG